MRIVQYIMAWGLLVMSMAACSGKDGEEAGKATSAKATRVAVVEVDECLPLIVAEHLGLLDSLHADVKLIRKGSIAECRQAVERGEADACVNDEAIEYKLITAKKARIKRISQLGDKVIAADKEGHSYELASMAVDSLMKAKQHVFIIQVEDLKVRLKMLTTGNVDAAMLPEPYATNALKQGGAELRFNENENENKGQLVNVPVPVSVKLKEPLRIANDSIRRFGKEHYERTWK